MANKFIINKCSNDMTFNLYNSVYILLDIFILLIIAIYFKTPFLGLSVNESHKTLLSTLRSKDKIYRG